MSKMSINGPGDEAILARYIFCPPNKPANNQISRQISNTAFMIGVKLLQRNEITSTPEFYDVLLNFLTIFGVRLCRWECQPRVCLDCRLKLPLKGAKFQRS